MKRKAKADAPVNKLQKFERRHIARSRKIVKRFLSLKANTLDASLPPTAIGELIPWGDSERTLSREELSILTPFRRPDDPNYDVASFLRRDAKRFLLDSLAFVNLEKSDRPNGQPPTLFSLRTEENRRRWRALLKMTRGLEGPSRMHWKRVSALCHKVIEYNLRLEIDYKTHDLLFGGLDVSDRASVERIRLGLYQALDTSGFPPTGGVPSMPGVFCLAAESLLLTCFPIEPHRKIKDFVEAFIFEALPECFPSFKKKGQSESEYVKSGVRHHPDADRKNAIKRAKRELLATMSDSFQGASYPEHEEFEKALLQKNEDREPGAADVVTRPKFGIAHLEEFDLAELDFAALDTSPKTVDEYKDSRRGTGLGRILTKLFCADGCFWNLGFRKII